MTATTATPQSKKERSQRRQRLQSRDPLGQPSSSSMGAGRVPSRLPSSIVSTGAGSPLQAQTGNQSYASGALCSGETAVTKMTPELEFT
jgi:hypothetical protein